MAATATLALPQRLTLTEAGATLDRLSAALAQQTDATVVVHAGSLDVFDSAALSVLLELRRRLLSKGKAMRVSGWPRRLEDLAGLYGVRELLEPA
jgi:phospholipid transport system transporter-binding protein